MDDDIPRGSVAMRGALMAGCSLWAPIVLPGCEVMKDAGTGNAALDTTPGSVSASGADSTAPATTTTASEGF